jgi:hypothetical protein
MTFACGVYDTRRAPGGDRPYPVPALILTRVEPGAQRRITELAPDIVIRDFDRSRDTGVILFDRIQESSRIALIERGA